MSKAYLSSTYEDLNDYRAAVYRGLRSLRYDVIGLEDYGATDERPLEKALQDVADADIYVGIFAHHYGYVLEGPLIRKDGRLPNSSPGRH
jgi:hypothetical protein